MSQFPILLPVLAFPRVQQDTLTSSSIIFPQSETYKHVSLFPVLSPVSCPCIPQRPKYNRNTFATPFKNTCMSFPDLSFPSFDTTCPDWLVDSAVATGCYLSLPSSQVPIPAGACEKVASDLGARQCFLLGSPFFSTPNNK